MGVPLILSTVRGGEYARYDLGRACVATRRLMMVCGCSECEELQKMLQSEQAALSRVQGQLEASQR